MADMPTQRGLIATLVLASLIAISQFGCGSGGGVTSPPPNPPIIEAVSPNGSQQGGPAFTLSVVGSNILSGATLRWNGSTMPTTVVNSRLVTADIPAGEVVATTSSR
jgi:hypothetical protein